MNRNFGKVIDSAIQYAPDAVRNGGRIILHPNAIGYATADDGPWLTVVDKPPQYIPDGYHYERRDPVDEDGVITWQYVLVKDPPPPPRVFRRSYLAQWIRGAGKWDAFAAFLAAPAAADIAFLWEYCTEFDEDNSSWPAALAAIKAALALTDEQVEAMLAYGATGGVA